MIERNKPFITILLPAYNEESIIEKSLEIIIEYLKSGDIKYSWEILIINDGSKDRTGMIADSLEKENSLIRVIHHPVNLNLGRALQTGFKNAKGEVIVVLDIDLSYSVEHIGRLVEKQNETDAEIVIASPYMKSGKVLEVPFKRAILSRVVNKFMNVASPVKIHTFTGMVRCYKTSFIRDLNLKSTDYEINPEILYKAMILRAKIIEIPAILDWSFQNGFSNNRSSSISLMRGFFSGLMAGFIFRPYIYFIGIGILLFLISMYVIAWIFINTFDSMQTINVASSYFDERFSQAIGLVYSQRPHAFFIGGITLLLSINTVCLGIISLQNKRYFEELFHINTSILGTHSIKSEN
jgi:dolichol-phosphate mannosyltransferase